MHERGVVKRDTPIQKMGMHRRGGRNGYPFRAKCGRRDENQCPDLGQCFRQSANNERTTRKATQA